MDVNCPSHKHLILSLSLSLSDTVNNQSACYEHPQYFALLPHRCMWKLMDVNVVAPTVMTHMLLPQMVERQRGAVINVCSAASLTPPTPLQTAYIATSVSVI